MPKILHVIGGLEIGGAEMALYRLITGSVDGKYEHAVVALTPDGPMGDRLLASGIELTTFDFRKAPIAHFFGLFSYLRRNQPDNVQTWMYHADMFGGLAARLAGNRNIIWGIRTSELTAGSSKMTVLARRICAWLSSQLPHTIVCVAEAARRTHVRAGYDAKRMVVVPNGFDLSRLTAEEGQAQLLRRQCGFDDEIVVIGSLGRFNANKDQQNFVLAAGLLAQQYPQARFLMVGRGLDADNEDLGACIADTGHADRFVLLGERSDVPVCLAAMDIFCLSSRNEGFPNAVGEAMGMGVPCVVTDVGDAALLVGETGIVVPKEDSPALARGLECLLAMTPEARRQMGQLARTRILAEFTLDRTRERFESIYQRLLKGSEH